MATHQAAGSEQLTLKASQLQRWFAGFLPCIPPREQVTGLLHVVMGVSLFHFIEEQVQHGLTIGANVLTDLLKHGRL